MEDLMDALSLVGYMLMVLVFVVMPVAFVIMAVWEQQPKQEVIIHDYNFDEWTEVWNG
jgi:NADH:ubiquinone oxidoreductase subunit 3 (subunit A)